jgi:putative redox protein
MARASPNAFTTSMTSKASPTPGPVSRTIVRLKQQHLFESGPEGRTHLVDADATTAPGPIETLLGAVLCCSGVDVVDILAKRRTPVTSFVASAVAHRRAEHPRRVQRLELEFRIDGEGIDAEQAERAIELAFEKYCSVAASLGSDIHAESRLILNGRASEPRPRKMFKAVEA